MLRRLHDELHRAPRVDPASREMLHRLQEDIREVLEGAPEAGAKQGSDLRERLREPVERLETNHPDLAILIRDIINFLDNSGL